MNYLLDTNILLTYVRKTTITNRIEDKLNLLSGEHNLFISVVSLGEIRAIAKKNGWGSKKIQYLENLLNDFLVADINVEEVIERYAEIDAFSQGKIGDGNNYTARNMGKNDIWIAATASTYNIQLITTDKDFEHLRGKYLNLNWIDLSNFSK